MLNNIGLPGLLMILLIFVLPICLIVWLIVRIVRSSSRKAADQKRMADAVEELARLKRNQENE